MAEGRSNSGISRELWVTEGTVEKHVRSILMKLHLPETDDMHRRVLAVLTFLDARQPAVFRITLAVMPGRGSAGSPRPTVRPSPGSRRPGSRRPCPRSRLRRGPRS